MDDTGEYLELMAGVYTDNQPDFTWIKPYETKTFSQYWLPVQQIGGFKNANTHLAVNLEVRDDEVFLGVYPAEPMITRITLTAAGQTLLSEAADLTPGAAYLRQVSLPEKPVGDFHEADLLLRVFDTAGEEVIRYQPESPWDGTLAEPYQPPAAPQEMTSVEELYLAGLHLEQYRHTALSPEPYWQEALRRDPGDSRSHIALGRARFRSGLFASAEAHFRQAVMRLTQRNLNPYDGEAHYNLGLALQYQGQLAEAYKAFAKSAWSYAWRSAGNFALAQIDCQRSDWLKALEHLTYALQTDPEHNQARDLRCAVLRHLGRTQEASELALETLAADPLDHWARYELGLATGDTIHLDAIKKMTRRDVQTFLDIAFDYAQAGLWQDASHWLSLIVPDEPLYPMTAYALGYFARQSGQAETGSTWYRRGAQAEPDYCFPWRLQEMLVLQDVVALNPQDGRACYYLGNLLYDKQRYSEAVALWQRTVQAEPGFAIPWRNLGLASFNRDRDIDQALIYCQKAWEANSEDPRLLLELDQLRRRKGYSPQSRLELLEAHPEVVNQRDDLVIEYVALLNRLEQPQKALAIAAARSFHAWEGGEGRIAGQYANSHWLLGCQALEAGDPGLALEHFTQGIDFPRNLGVVPFDPEVIHLGYYRGLALQALGRMEEARDAFEKSAATLGGLHVAYYRALALGKLGKEAEALSLLKSLRQEALELVENGPQSNYFFAGKPSPIFEDDLRSYNRHLYLTALGLACLGLGDKVGAQSAFAQALSLNPANLFAYQALKGIANPL
jgi:tetratricopeptide (TPR) repeat protein